jgi:hypothetical protein
MLLLGAALGRHSGVCDVLAIAVLWLQFSVGCAASLRFNR